VIAIIGILAATVLVLLSNAKGKTNDSKIMSQANSMMKAAQVDAEGNNQDYTKWNIPSCDIRSADNCSDGTLPITASNGRPDVAKACESIVGLENPSDLSNLSVEAFYLCSSDFKKRLNIAVYLPYAKKMYCISSSGKTSTIMNLNGSGCGAYGGDFTCPGCYFD